MSSQQNNNNNRGRSARPRVNRGNNNNNGQRQNQTVRINTARNTNINGQTRSVSQPRSQSRGRSGSRGRYNNNNNNNGNRQNTYRSNSMGRNQNNNYRNNNNNAGNSGNNRGRPVLQRPQLKLNDENVGNYVNHLLKTANQTDITKWAKLAIPYCYAPTKGFLPKYFCVNTSVAIKGEIPYQFSINYTGKMPATLTTHQIDSMLKNTIDVLEKLRARVLPGVTFANSDIMTGAFPEVNAVLRSDGLAPTTNGYAKSLFDLDLPKNNNNNNQNNNQNAAQETPAEQSPTLDATELDGETEE
nr:MAG: hypothetical protein [Ips virga-like virus 1]